MPQHRPRQFVKLGCRAVCRAYLRLWHQFEAHGLEHLPPRGPGLALINHASLLDIPALIAVDPFEDGTMVAKASLFKVPFVRQVLDAWGAIPVERQGRDLAGIRALMGALRQGRIVAVAAEGRRTRTGRLEPIHPVLARIALNADVPLIPVGIAGSFAALPPGAMFPRPRKIVLRVGEPFQLPPGTSEAEAAGCIRDAIAALLPPEQRPLGEGSGTEGPTLEGHSAAPGH